MSAQQGAPALGRAQVATPTLWNAPQGSSIPREPRPARMTRRAMAVTAATLCAPMVAAIGLVAIATAGGGNQAEMGTLAGTQGLRGSTVAASGPAPTQVSGPPADGWKAKAGGTDKGTAAEPKRDSTQETSSQPQREPAPTTRAPEHKAPTHTAPEPPSSRVNPDPTAPAPAPTVDSSDPGAPIPGSTGGTSGGVGSSVDSGSSSGSSSSSDTDYPEGPDGQSGGD
jgi:hypothetical protein